MSEIDAAEVAYVVPPEVVESIATDDPQVDAAMPTIEVTPEPPDRAIEAIDALGAQIERKLDALAGRFDREVRAEATREKVVDRLHAELQEYKQDLLLNTLRPMFVDLIQLHDDMGKMADARAGVEGLADALRGYQQGIEDILYRQGVEPYSVDGPTFDPRRQRAASTVPADDPALAKTVATRLRKGFSAGEKVIRPEVVAVYSAQARASAASAGTG